ncbi:MAG: helix-turn-helix domain-containing protein [Phycisphaeraceae bacterium]|nr:helix-turn-helix domain-containing protein [Phycisphaeraceae bacterium]
MANSKIHAVPKPKVLAGEAFLRQLLNPHTVCRVVVMGRQTLNEGWQLGSGMVAEHRIFGMESGAVTCHIGDRQSSLRPGGLVWFQPGEQYNLTQECRERARLMFYRIFLSVRQRPIRIKPPLIESPANPHACTLMSSLLPDHSLADDYEPLRRRALLAALLCHLLSGQQRPTLQEGLQLQQRQLALSFIHQNMSNRFTIDDLARHVGLNSAYFTRRFKCCFGATPQAYIKSVRIRAAAALLAESKQSVSQIADQMGYEDIYFFSRQFKEVMGASPLHWRKQVYRSR